VVNLATETPNLIHYETSRESEQWTATSNDFKWPLKEGTNRLGVRAVNTYGVVGPETRINIIQSARR